MGSQLEYNIMFRERNGGIQVIVQYKDKNGKWQQKSKQGFRGKSAKKLAKLEAEKILDSIRENYDYNQDYINMPVSFFKEKYLEHISIHKEHNTYLNYKQSLDNFSNIDEINISSLKLIDVQNCINCMVKKGYSFNTLDRRATIFKMFIKWTSDNFDIKVLKLNKLTIPSSKRTEIKEKTALDTKEIDKLIEYFKSRQNYSIDYYIAVLFASKLGLRIGEIAAITPKNISLKEKHLLISRQWKILKETKKYGFGDLKTKNSYRLVPFSEGVKKAIKEILEIRGIDPNTRLISASSTRSLNTNLDKVLNRNFNISIHELRHSYVTNLIHAGLDFKTIAQLIGDDVEEVLRTYSHVTPAMLQTARDKIENIDINMEFKKEKA